MRTAKKVQQRKPNPSMRKNRPEQKNTKKTETATKTGANEKTYPVREKQGATWTPPCSQVSQPTGRRPKKNSAKRDGEKRGVGSFGAQGLHHARHPVESRKNGEGLTCPGLSSTKPGGLSFTLRPSRFPWVKHETFTCGGLASRRGDDGGGGGGGTQVERTKEE